MFFLYFLASFGLASFGLASVAWADENPEQHLLQAQMRMERRDYEKSTEILNHLMRVHNGSPEAVEAKFLMADIFFQKQEWPTARIYYQQFLKDHPSHPKAAKALLRVGETHEKDAPNDTGRDQRATQAAINIWNQFLLRYPESEYRQEVEANILQGKEKLAQKELDVAIFYSKKEKWESVRRRTEFLLQTYPGSSFVPKALLLNTLSYVFLGQSDIASAKRETLSTLAPELIETLEARIMKGR